MNSLEHRSLLHRELASLLAAGFPIDKAAATLLARKPDRRRRAILEALRDGLAHGRTIAESFAPAVSEMEHSLIDATERGGRVADGLSYLGDYFALRARTRSRLLQQMIYPALLLHLCLLPGALPLIFTKGFRAFVFAVAGPLLALYALVFLVVWGGRRLLHVAGVNPWLDRCLRAVPVFGNWRRAESLSRFCKVLEISLLAGRMPSQAVTLAASASDSALVRQSSARIATHVTAGHLLGPEMAGDPAFPIELADGLASAEVAGTLEREAGRWAGYLQAEANQAADLVAQWLPRIIYAVAVVVTAVIIIRFFLNYIAAIKGLT